MLSCGLHAYIPSTASLPKLNAIFNLFVLAEILQCISSYGNSIEPCSGDN